MLKACSGSFSYNDAREFETGNTSDTCHELTELINCCLEPVLAHLRVLVEAQVQTTGTLGNITSSQRDTTCEIAVLRQELAQIGSPSSTSRHLLRGSDSMSLLRESAVSNDGGAVSHELSHAFFVGEESDCTNSGIPPKVTRFTSRRSFYSTLSDEEQTAAQDALPMTLPTDWPSVPKRTGLEGSGWSMKSVQHSLHRKQYQTTKSTLGVIDLEEKSPLIIRPDSWFSTAWECLALVMLIVEMCLLPFFLAFDVDLEGGVLVLVWVLVCFWTLDVLLSLNTGFWTDHGLEMRRWVVVRSRLMSWAFFDLVLVVCDWTSLLLSQMLDPKFARVVRFFKLSKLIRAAMLLRLIRLARVLEKWLERFLSGDLGAIFKIFGLLLIAVWLSHVFGCLWYALGKSDTDTWLDLSRSDGIYFRQLAIGSIYCTSVHWAIAQLTLGSVDVAAFTDLERLFSIAVMIFGLLFGSTIVSSVSATLISSQIRAGERAQRTHNLEVYLKQNRVGTMLSYQVRKVATAGMRRPDVLLEKDVDAVNFLPNSMKDELRYAVFQANLQKHKFFTAVAAIDSVSARVLCCDSLNYHLMQSGDDLFTAGITGEHAYCLVSGDMKYFQDPRTSPVFAKKVEMVRENSWLSEATLWVEWIHVGRAFSLTACQVLTVAAESLIRTLKKHRLVQQFSFAYSTEYHRRLCDAKPPFHTWPTDLSVPGTDFSEILFSIPQDIRSAMGLHVVTPNLRQDLREEVLQGTSSMVPSGNGQPQRVVLVIAFHITRDDGRVLFQLGIREEEGGVFPSCTLPGGKYRPDDDVDEAAQRVLETKLAPLSGNLRVIRSRREEDENTSLRHGMLTKYVRTVYFASMYRPGMPLWRLAHQAQHSLLSTVPHLLSSSPKTFDTTQWDIFAIEHNQRTTVYAWLTQEEFRLLGARDQEIEDFLSELMLSLLSGSVKEAEKSPDKTDSDRESTTDRDSAQDMDTSLVSCYHPL